MMDVRFDEVELKFQAEEINGLINDLRPYPLAKLISRQKMGLIAVLSGDEDLISLLKTADDHTLFWEIEGDYVETRIDFRELPAS